MLPKQALSPMQRLSCHLELADAVIDIATKQLCSQVLILDHGNFETITPAWWKANMLLDAVMTSFTACLLLSSGIKAASSHQPVHDPQQQQ